MKMLKPLAIVALLVSGQCIMGVTAEDIISQRQRLTPASKRVYQPLSQERIAEENRQLAQKMTARDYFSDMQDRLKHSADKVRNATTGSAAFLALSKHVKMLEAELKYATAQYPDMLQQELYVSDFVLEARALYDELRSQYPYAATSQDSFNANNTLKVLEAVYT